MARLSTSPGEVSRANRVCSKPCASPCRWSKRNRMWPSPPTPLPRCGRGERRRPPLLPFRVGGPKENSMQIDLPIDIFTYPEIPLPEVWTVEQKFDTPALTPDQITAAVQQAVAELAKDARLKPGANVAVGVGSRGLDNLVLVVRTAIAELKARGLKPFIVPAMGSHGGATAEGQASVLRDYGITPENVGAEIRATMEADVIGHLEGEDAGPYTGYPVYYDRNARHADAVLVINRIKPHTDFAGELESGVGKMCAIGLGKQRGAASIHTYGARGLREIMPRIARYMARHANVVGGIAL